MESLVAAAGVILVAVASIFAAIFQAKHRGKAEGEAEHHGHKAEQAEEILGDVRVANAARDAAGRDNREFDRLRAKYDRDQNPPE